MGIQALAAQLHRANRGSFRLHRQLRSIHLCRQCRIRERLLLPGHACAAGFALSPRSARLVIRCRFAPGALLLFGQRMVQKCAYSAERQFRCYVCEVLSPSYVGITSSVRAAADFALRALFTLRDAPFMRHPFRNGNRWQEGWGRTEQGDRSENGQGGSRSGYKSPAQSTSPGESKFFQSGYKPKAYVPL